MISMLRALFLASLVLVGAGGISGQTLSVLRIKVVVVDAGTATPVPRHVLLVSDNPASAPPRRIVTAQDGTAEVKLPPGTYTVESDRPTRFRGKAYQWTQMIDIVAGRDATLELTADNADTDPVTSAATSSADDPAFLVPRWQDSVVAIWTPDRRASGFLIDAKGLVATNQRSIGAATTVEVQLTPTVKVAARVLAADAARDVAVLWIDPTVVAAVRPVPLECAQATKPAVAVGQQLFTIGAPLREQKGMTTGSVGRMDSNSVIADFRLSPGGAGGPVFAADGALVGISSVIDGNDESRPGPSRIVRIDAVCGVVASAEQRMRETAAPAATHLPVEPVRPFPIDALKAEAHRRAGNLNPRQISSSDFDVAFITPVLVYAAQTAAQAAGREGSRGPLTDFGNWSEYVEDFPPVLLIRVTPKLVEGFWAKVARGAARTQGAVLPPIKHFTSGFSRMRVLCGDAEVTPIHPFTLEQRISDSEAIQEGLYVFDPGALGPHCGTATLVLYSEKEPEKGDVRVIDPSVLQDIWLHFAPYRALTGSPPLRRKEIPSPANRAEEPWMLRVRLEFSSQLPHVHVDRARVRQDAVTPNALQQLVPEHHAAFVANQMAQHLELTARELDGLPSSQHASFVEVHTDVSELEEGRTRAAIASTPPSQRLDSCEQFWHLKRLRQIVVCAHPQAGHSIGHVSARCQHQDRGLDLAERLPPLFAPNGPAMTKYEATGAHPDAHYFGLSDSLDLLSQIGTERIQARLFALTARWLPRAQRVPRFRTPVTLDPAQCAGLVSWEIEGVDRARIREVLAERRILVGGTEDYGGFFGIPETAPRSLMIANAGLFTAPADVDRLADAIEAAGAHP